MKFLPYEICETSNILTTRARLAFIADRLRRLGFHAWANAQFLICGAETKQINQFKLSPEHLKSARSISTFLLLVFSFVNSPKLP